MWYSVLAVLVGVSSAMVLDGIENIDDGFEPLVAFKCGYASNYLTRAGWQADQTRSCLSKPVDIMAYCVAKYPNLTITNVIPSPSEVESNWTVLNGSSIEAFKVRPYRCIVDEFDSDALVVPDGCTYGTSVRSNYTECASYFEWNATAHERCASDQSELFSFGVVRPCGVGTFHYMEFVCCPLASKLPASDGSSPNAIAEPSQKPTTKPPRPQMQRSTPQQPASGSWDYDIDYAYEEGQLNDWYEVSAESEISEDDYDEDGAYQYDMYATEDEDQYGQEFEDDMQYEDDEYFNEDDTFDPAAESVDLYDSEDYDPTKNYFQVYMDAPKQLGNTETEIYAKALRYVKRYYDGQKQRLLQQLAEAEARMMDSKNVSAARITLAEDIETIRRLYETTEKTWNDVKASMLEEHERRIAKDRRSERELQSEAWKNAVRQLRPNSTFENLTQLFGVLKRYINSEENERLFWINRYETLLDNNPVAAQSIRPAVKTVLRAIQQRLESIVESLKRDGVAKVVIDGVQALSKDYLKNFTDLDNEVRTLFPDLDVDSAIDTSTADEFTSATGYERLNDLNNSDDVDEVKTQFSDDEEDPRVAEQKPVMLIVVASAGSFVLVLVLVSVVVLVCSVRKRRNAQHTDHTRSRRHKAALHHGLFLVPDATKHGSLEPLHLDSGARRILVDMPPSPRPSVYAQTTHSGDRRIRGHDNPLNNYAGIVFSDSAPLVENDMLNEDAKRVA